MKVDIITVILPDKEEDIKPLEGTRHDVIGCINEVIRDFPNYTSLIVVILP